MSSDANNGNSPGLANLKRFPKGTSGNPSGRPKGYSKFRKEARDAVDSVVVAKWRAEVENGGPNWVKCSEHLAHYGYGKPPNAPADNKAIAASGSGLPRGLTAEQAMEIAKAPLEEK